MSNKTDRTKQHIIETFFEMMSDIGFEQIRVSSLAKRAGINRGTFYHHFLDKYEILEEVENEMYTNFRLLLEEQLCLDMKILDNESPNIQALLEKTCLEIMIFLYERKELAQVLLGKNGRPQFIEKLESLYCQTVRNNMNPNNQDDDYQTHYLQEFVFSGIISVIKCWLRNGAKETPEEVANIIAISLTNSPKNILKD